MNVFGENCYGDVLAAIGSGYAKRLTILNLRMRGNVGHDHHGDSKGLPLIQEWNLALCHGFKISGCKSIGLNCKAFQKKKKTARSWRNFVVISVGIYVIVGCGLREKDAKDSSVVLSGHCQISSAAVELFKLYRGHIELKEEQMAYDRHWIIA